MTRGFSTKLYAMMILIIMWVLSLSTVLISAYVWFFDMKIEGVLIAVTSSLLFSLPAMRNTQAAAPPIGCTLDTAGFFWNMALVGWSVFLLLLKYTIDLESSNLAAVSVSQCNSREGSVKLKSTAECFIAEVDME